jgi:hypothetical protein
MSSFPQHLSHLPLPPLLLPLTYLLHNLPNLPFLLLLPIRLPIPTLLQLSSRRFFKPPLHIRIFLQRLEYILIRRKERRAQTDSSEFECNDGEEDEDQGSPPVYIGAKKVQESVADVVYFARVRVEARQDDIPEKPAADRAEEGEGICEGFGVCFDESNPLVKTYSRDRTRSGGNKGDR